VLLDASVSLLDRGSERLASGVRGEKRSDRDGHLVKVLKQRRAVQRRDQHSTKAKAGQTGLAAIAKQYRARRRS
jgi:hypothetical protein